MRQFDADVRRFFARRIVRGTIIVALLIAVVSIAIPTVRGHAPRVDNTGFRTEIQTGTAPDGTPLYTSSGPNPTPDTRLNVGHSLHGAFEGLAILMIFVGATLGASFVGAEFNLGSLTSQLLYEPRRWRVHLAKAGAVAIGCAAFAAGLCITVGALMYAGSELHGVMQGITGLWWKHRAIDVVRATGTGAAAAVMAYTVAVLTRRTSAAIVAFFVQYPFILIVKPHAAVFGPLSHYAPMRGLLTVAIDPTTNRDSNVDLLIHTSAGAIAFACIWVVVLLAVSGAVFSRSEVR